MTLFDPSTASETFAPIFVEIGKDVAGQIWNATAGRIKKTGDEIVAARRYREEIIKQYDKMQIYGQARPTALLDIFTDVHVLTKPLAMQRYTIANLEAWFQQRDRATSLHEREERKPGLDMLAETSKLFILGKPGAGKTTFLKYLAVWAAKGHKQLPKIPIFISLKEYSDADEDLMAFIERQFAICDFANARPFVERLLEKGKALVLCDGLDEVSENANLRSTIIDDLRNFARKYRESTMVVTCRLAATDYTFEGFTYVEMADFTPAQVEHFVGRWFTGHDDTRQRMLADLRQPEHQGILELTQNPLLLSLLCIAYEETLTFPVRRVEVYEDAVDALLRKWDSSRQIKRDDVYRKLSLGRKRQMLARIAYDTFSRGEYFLPQPKLEKQIVDYLARVPEAPEEVDIDGEAVLRAIAAQHGLLVERSQRIYSFSHLTFQEYFAAKYIADNEARGALDELMARAFDDPWREVFLLVASLLADADAFFERFLTHLNGHARQHDLTALLRWADESGQRLQREVDADANARGNDLPRRYSAAANRIWAVVLDLARALVRDLDLDRAHAYDLAFDFDLALVLHLDLDLARHGVLDLARQLALDLALDLDLACSLDFSRQLARAKKLGLIEFSQALASLSASPDLAAPGAWEDYAEQLQAVIAKHRPSVMVLQRVQYEIAKEDATPKLTVEQWEYVAEYLMGVRLLVDCLDVAYVSNRQAIEDRLLLPPSIIQGNPDDT